VPHGGCDCDFGAGNGTAYLVVDNPYGPTLPLDITYHIGGGERNDSMVLNVSETRAVVFCGLGDGWLYIQQHASPLRRPLAWYPLAVPRYVVLQAGESATMSVTTLFAPAATIAVAFLLLVAVALRPRLRRSAVYALPDALRDADIWRPASNVGGDGVYCHSRDSHHPNPTPNHSAGIWTASVARIAFSRRFRTDKKLTVISRWSR